MYSIHLHIHTYTNILSFLLLQMIISDFKINIYIDIYIQYLLYLQYAYIAIKEIKRNKERERENIIFKAFNEEYI